MRQLCSTVGSFFSDGVGKQGLVTVYGKPGSGMKQPDFFLPAWVSKPSGGKQYPYFRRLSSCFRRRRQPAAAGPPLALQFVPLPRHCQVVDFNLYQSVVGFQVSFPLLRAYSAAGADMWQLVHVGECPLLG